jgi:RNA polymerase sigma-70 factor (ECF subfamily)
MSEGSSSGLADAARGGDPYAIAGLYDTYAARLLGFVRGLGVTDPEDTVGEIFLSVVRDIGRFQGDDDDFRRWLFTIAYRRAMDAHRSRARRREDPTDPQAMPDRATTDDFVDALVDRVGEGSRARAALEGLTDDQRAVVSLRIMADLSVADTADVLGKQPGAVKTLQRRALAALRRSLIILAVSG